MQHVTAVLCCPRSRPTVTCRSACSPRGPTPCCNHTALPSRGTAGGIGSHLVVKGGTTCSGIYRPASPRVRLASILTDGLHLEPVAHFEGLVQRHPHHTTKTVYFQGTACREKQETDERTLKWKIEQQKSCRNECSLLECGLNRSLGFAWHKTITATKKCQSTLGGERKKHGRAYRSMFKRTPMFCNLHINRPPHVAVSVQSNKHKTGTQSQGALEWERSPHWQEQLWHNRADFAAEAPAAVL